MRRIATVSMLAAAAVVSGGCLTTTHGTASCASGTRSILAAPIGHFSSVTSSFPECLRDFDDTVEHATSGTGRLGYVFVPPRRAAEDQSRKPVSIRVRNADLHRALLALAKAWGYRVILSDPIIRPEQTTYQRVGEVFFVRQDMME